jgi:nucleotide-binding universal stress UspA family protein
MKPYQRILMATDFSEASLPAWKRALAMAKENQRALFVIHAYEPPNVVQAAAVAPFVYEEWNQNVRASVRKKLDLLVGEAQTAGVHATGIVEAGNPDESILKAADDYHADLIIMGTHGRKGVSRIFLGSVASRVIASAPCAVLTVRLPEEPAFQSRLASDVAIRGSKGGKPCRNPPQASWETVRAAAPPASASASASRERILLSKRRP